MVRIALLVSFAIGACTPAQAPTARKIGKVLAIGGVVGLIGTAATNGLTGYTSEILLSFSGVSAVGIGTFAAGELAAPGTISETMPERNTRWAKILTERAAGAARDGRCRRVQRLEVRVRTYDPEIHDFVFMRDPEILKCLAEPAAIPAEAPDAPRALEVPDASDPTTPVP
jgi:hypothetical protein